MTKARDLYFATPGRFAEQPDKLTSHQLGVSIRMVRYWRKQVEAIPRPLPPDLLPAVLSLPAERLEEVLLRMEIASDNYPRGLARDKLLAQIAVMRAAIAGRDN